jgi:hypothetical protein
VATEDELEQLSSKELHDRATKHAKRHANIKFFWNLRQALPAAEAAAGELGEAEDDVHSLYGFIGDAHDASEGAVADALRPLYIEYLLKHPDA